VTGGGGGGVTLLGLGGLGDRGGGGGRGGGGLMVIVIMLVVMGTMTWHHPLQRKGRHHGHEPQSPITNDSPMPPRCVHW
jgi:hypothetical protein